MLDSKSTNIFENDPGYIKTSNSPCDYGPLKPIDYQIE